MSTSPAQTGGVTDNRASIPPPHPPHPRGHSDVPISSHASLSTASKLAVLRVAKAKAKTNQSFNEQGQGNKVRTVIDNQTKASEKEIVMVDIYNK